MSIATSPFSFSTKMLKPLQFFLIIALGGTSQSLPKNIPYWRQQTDVTETSFLSLFFKMLFYIIVFSILAIDGLRFFWFSQKIAHAHISGRQNKNKQKEKHAQSSDQLVNRVPTSIVSVDFEKKYARQFRGIWMYKSKVNYFFTILSYTFSETIS